MATDAQKRGTRKAAQAAERELLELIRGQGAAEFTLTIACRAGRWNIEIENPKIANYVCTGEGRSFTEAWQECQVEPSA